ncbi:MAG: HAD family hydrolase [Pseudomonadota bacterium]
MVYLKREPEIGAIEAPSRAELAVLQAHPGPVLVDLDETLYLRNSTEDFIDTATPGVVVLVFLKVLDLVKPWRWTGGIKVRDTWRIRLLLLLFPWTLRRWRNRVKTLAASARNQPLADALHARGDAPIIVTVGFEPVVKPLVDALGFAGVRIVATDPWRFEDRCIGKRRLAEAALGSDTVARSAVITDSLEDSDLLEACATPLHVIWPDARWQAGLGSIYVPGRYLHLVKRPGKNDIRRSILQDELPMWLLATIWLATFPVLHTLAVMLLMLSFWAIYEVGYVDNDKMAEKYEAEPTLSETYTGHTVATPMIAPWVWAAISGAIGLTLLSWPSAPSYSVALAWLGVLVTIALCFRLYNRLDPASRIWLYPALRLGRTAALIAVAPMVPQAVAAITANTTAAWIAYLQSRQKRDWTASRPNLVRLIFFALMMLLLGTAVGPELLLGPPTLAFLVFFTFKARNDILEVWSGMRRIDRSAP